MSLRQSNKIGVRQSVHLQWYPPITTYYPFQCWREYRQLVAWWGVLVSGRLMYSSLPLYVSICWGRPPGMEMSKRGFLHEKNINAMYKLSSHQWLPCTDIQFGSNQAFYLPDISLQLQTYASENDNEKGMTNLWQLGNKISFSRLIFQVC